MFLSAKLFLFSSLRLSGCLSFCSLLPVWVPFSFPLFRFLFLAKCWTDVPETSRFESKPETESGVENRKGKFRKQFLRSQTHFPTGWEVKVNATGFHGAICRLESLPPPARAMRWRRPPRRSHSLVARLCAKARAAAASTATTNKELF